MSNSKLWSILLIGLALAGFVWALDEKTKRISAETKLKQKEDDYLELLSKYLESKKELPQKIKDQILGLRNEYIGIDDAIAIRLKEVVELIEEEKESIAIEKLTLIIENIIKEKYIREGYAKDKKSCPPLFKLLEKARDSNWITKHHFNYSLFIKDKRNEEAHELKPGINENERIIAFFSGLEIIYYLSGYKRIA